MLLPLFVAAVLCGLGLWLIAQILLRVLARLDLEPMAVLLWFGLAESDHASPGAPARVPVPHVVERVPAVSGPA